MAKNPYQLLHNTANVDYVGGEEVEIAKIIEISTGEDVMYIVYSRDLYKVEGVHTGIFVYEDEGKENVVAKVDDINRPCLFENGDIFFALMLHELGHYKNGDFDTDETLTTESIMEDRTACIMGGKVMDRELKADAFAVKCIGKNKFLRSLDYLINKRKQRGDDGMQLALKEFELRKKAVCNIR